MVVRQDQAVASDDEARSKASAPQLATPTRALHIHYRDHRGAHRTCHLDDVALGATQPAGGRWPDRGRLRAVLLSICRGDPRDAVNRHVIPHRAAGHSRRKDEQERENALPYLGAGRVSLASQLFHIGSSSLPPGRHLRVGGPEEAVSPSPLPGVYPYSRASSTRSGARLADLPVHRPAQGEGWALRHGLNLLSGATSPRAGLAMPVHNKRAKNTRAQEAHR